MIGLCLALAFFIAGLYTIPIVELYELPDEAVVSYTEMNQVGVGRLQTRFDLSPTPTAEHSPTDGTISFGFAGFPLRTLKAKILPVRKVFKGGYPIGMILECNGVLVVGVGDVTTSFGSVGGAKELKKGDIIKKIGDKTILHVDDISEALEGCDKRKVRIVIDRAGERHNVDVAPILDSATNKYKLGVWVKDRVSGLGTVSFVKPNRRYGALGHPIIDSDTGRVFPCYRGSAFKASVLGVNKGQPGVPGELKGAFNPLSQPIGTIDQNNLFGVFGFFDQLGDEQDLVDVGSRMTIKPGKAKILTSIGDGVQEFDIEIVKINNQTQASDKSMVIRVTDKRLIEATGGIVQGMSGSPIMQNGRLIGAVTHVFVSDPTKGYGIFVDWMIEQ